MLSKRKIEERKVRQDKILDGALRVFKIHGIEKTTMDDIANESGFGKATLYYYYGSKDEVFVAIMEQGWKNLWEAIENKIVEEKSPKNKFIGIVKEMGLTVKSNSNLYGFLFTAPNYIQDTSQQTWKTYQERLYAILKSILDEGIKQNEFVNMDTGVLMKAIGGIFHGLFINSKDDINEHDIELMLNNLLNPK